MAEHEPDTAASSVHPGLDQITRRIDFPANRFSQVLDGVLLHLGRAASWLWLAVLATVIANVTSRLLLSGGSIWLEELSWHLFGAAMLLTLGYALVTDSHVRVDIFHERFDQRTQAIVELLFIALLLLPLVYVLLTELIPYAHRSYIFNERSQAPSGLPYRWVLKSMLPLGIALIGLGAVSRLSKCLTVLTGFPRALPPEQTRDTAS
jgi:TRAP-type mannitol/chloroaromatic compound transport system permease small subunit